MSKSCDRNVVIIGSGISGNLLAAYLRRRQPGLNIYVIDKPERRDGFSFPIVGESLTEFSAHLIHEIGLGRHLEEEQFHKYGLTFYFKENIKDPTDSTYAVHEAPAIPPLPSNQLNRFTFDRHLQNVNRKNGVHYINGMVIDVDLNKDCLHEVMYRHDTGIDSLKGAWVIDASGRGRFLTRKLKLQKPVEHQRSSFWFRLVNFNQDLFHNINAIKKPNFAFDSYYATHHFMGSGNWIWCIPMKTNEHRNMISIGIIFRPDIYRKDILNLDQFMAAIAEEHPFLVPFIKSGTILDKHAYTNYMYQNTSVYSRDRWCIVGDAGDTVDPLYSTGLAMTSIQITQVNAIISKYFSNTLTDQYLGSLEDAYKGLRDAMQLEIGKLYEVSDDPYQCSWRMHLASSQYFFFFLPAWLSGHMTDQFGAEVFKGVMDFSRPNFSTFHKLLGKASEGLGHITSESLPNQYDKTVNWSLRGPCDQDISRYMARLMFLCARFRYTFLKHAKWHGWMFHGRIILQDIFRGLILMTLFRNGPLKNWKFLMSVLLGRKIRKGRTNTVVQTVSAGRSPEKTKHPANTNCMVPDDEILRRAL